jgi:hypothetical protein
MSDGRTSRLAQLLAHVTGSVPDPLRDRDRVLSKRQ